MRFICSHSHLSSNNEKSCWLILPGSPWLKTPCCSLGCFYHPNWGHSKMVREEIQHHQSILPRAGVACQQLAPEDNLAIGAPFPTPIPIFFHCLPLGHLHDGEGWDEILAPHLTWCPRRPPRFTKWTDLPWSSLSRVRVWNWIYVTKYKVLRLDCLPTMGMMPQ